MEPKRLAAVQSYVKQRLAGNITEVLNLLSDDCVLVDSDEKKTEYTGKESIKKYFEARPPPMISPFISEPQVNKDNTITITLSALVKTLTVTFYFVTDSSIIAKLVLVDGGILSKVF